MEFYSYEYLVSNQDTRQLIKIAVICGLVLAVSVFFILYLKNRFEIKYKDLGIIFATALILVLAMQYNDFSNILNVRKQTGQITQTVKNIAKQLDVSPKQLSINSTSQTTNLLVKSPKGFYRADFNTDGSSFVLEKVTLYKPKIKIIRRQ